MNKYQFFKSMDDQGIALTYEDVRLRTGYSKVMPHEVDTTTLFSRNVSLKIPLVSAAMDTVTEAPMAIAMAQLGGLGVIHRNMTPEKQAQQVHKVKKHLNGVVDNPICVNHNMTVEHVLNMRKEHEYSFRSFPVVDDNGLFVGVVTGNDFDFCLDPQTPISQIMTPEKQAIFGLVVHSKDESYVTMQTHKKKVLPLLSTDGRPTQMYCWSDLQRIHSGKSNSYNVDANGQLIVAAAVGTGHDTTERVQRLIEAGVDVIVIDTAHGDSTPVYETLKAIKEHHEVDVVIGNVSEESSALRLRNVGADGLKCGQGPGAICSTRIVAGIGTPQLTAVYHCAKGVQIPVCADGGLRYSGDITIALGAGASSVMMGSMLAGTKEAPGDKIFLNGRSWKYYRGMGSLSAMRESRSSRERYRQTEEKLVPEGVEGRVPYKGSLEDAVTQYVGGLRAGMGYVGASNIQELQEKAQFYRITSAGVKESHPHDITILNENL